MADEKRIRIQRKQDQAVFDVTAAEARGIAGYPEEFETLDVPGPSDAGYGVAQDGTKRLDARAAGKLGLPPTPTEREREAAAATATTATPTAPRRGAGRRGRKAAPVTTTSEPVAVRRGPGRPSGRAAATAAREATAPADPAAAPATGSES